MISLAGLRLPLQPLYWAFSCGGGGAGAGAVAGLFTFYQVNKSILIMESFEKMIPPLAMASTAPALCPAAPYNWQSGEGMCPD